jgi:hypothetical protein
MHLYLALKLHYLVFQNLTHAKVGLRQSINVTVKLASGRITLLLYL